MHVLLLSLMLPAYADTPAATASPPASVAAAPAAGPVETIASSELDRAMQTFASRPDKPYYAAVAITDEDQITIQARGGTIAQDDDDHERYLDVDLRVGTPDLDSTHELRGFSAMESDDRQAVLLPLSDDEEFAMRHAIWRELDERYREAAERIVMVRANQQVKVEEESPAADFEPRATPIVDRETVPPLDVDTDAWRKLLVDVSQRLERDANVHYAVIGLQAVREEKTFVDTEGTHLVHGRTGLRVSLQAQSTADDGDVVSVFDAVDAHTAKKLPTADELYQWAEQASREIAALRAAPRGEPYSGPVLLSGRAAGVFFHEVFGHRVEGTRQKHEDEGKTFAKYVGQKLLPDFLDVFDDPTIEQIAGIDLNGFYKYDDEGVPAQRATLVDHGVFQGFLMGRSPIEGFLHSNGHGRRSPGMPPVARMGNTIVQSRQATPHAKLVALLLDEVKKQGLPFGMLVDEIEGGFTLTGRVEPNAFNVRASTSWRVYPDGHQQLVRGIDLVGTPLVAFKNLVATGDDPSVFNGFCGAESGWVPVSAVAPSIMFRTLEFQLKEKGQERPPLLAKPEFDEDGAADVPEDVVPADGGAR